MKPGNRLGRPKKRDHVSLQNVPLSSVDKRLILEREIELELQGTLEPWQRTLCRWLAIHARTHLKRQCEVATVLAGRDVSAYELRQLKYKRAWRDAWTALRGEHEQQISEARDIYADLLPKAAQTYRKAVGKLDKGLASQEPEAVMSAVRAAPALLTPLIDRSWPRKQEGTGQPSAVNITLTVAQAAALHSEETVVESEVVEAEIVPA